MSDHLKLVLLLALAQTNIGMEGKHSDLVCDIYYGSQQGINRYTLIAANRHALFS